jgi:hypothetical protein
MRLGGRRLSMPVMLTRYASITKSIAEAFEPHPPLGEGWLGRSGRADRSLSADAGFARPGDAPIARRPRPVWLLWAWEAVGALHEGSEQGRQSSSGRGSSAVPRLRRPAGAALRALCIIRVWSIAVR